MSAIPTTKNTVNQDEVDKFGNRSSDWWSLRGDFKVLHSMNQIRVPLIASTIDRNATGRKRILDIGCGGGFLSEGLGKHFQSLGYSDDEIEIIGLEPAQGSVTVAISHLPPELKGKVSYVCDNIENYLQLHPNEKFDTVVMSEVIEHVENPKEFFKYAVSIAKPGGSIILTTPAKTFFSWLGVIMISEYITRMVPRGTHEYKKFIALNDCKEMFKENGCEIKATRGTFYNPINSTWKWNDFCQVFCYAIHATKI